MKLSSPIHVLKTQAKRLKKEQDISMSEALNQIAKKEGFNSWSLLASKKEEVYPSNYSEILSFFNQGDLVLIGSRPGIGKTSFTIGLFVQAIEQKAPKGFYFSLAENHKDIAGRIAIYNKNIGRDANLFELNYSNDICAEFIKNKTKDQIKPGSLILIDYLQLLDEKRINPPLQNQIEILKQFAKETGCIIIFLSQIDRKIETRSDQRPTINDIRLPNPLDINLFNKIIFLYRETIDAKEVEVTFAGKTKHQFYVAWNKEKIKYSDLLKD